MLSRMRQLFRRGNGNSVLCVQMDVHVSPEPLKIKGFFLKILFTFRERVKERKREGEKHYCERQTPIGCLSYMSQLGMNMQARQVP